MTDIAIRVENLSKLCPSILLRAGRIGRAQERHDTPSTPLGAGLRDALVSAVRASDMIRSTRHASR